MWFRCLTRAVRAFRHRKRSKIVVNSDDYKVLVDDCPQEMFLLGPINSGPARTPSYGLRTGAYFRPARDACHAPAQGECRTDGGMHADDEGCREAKGAFGRIRILLGQSHLMLTRTLPNGEWVTKVWKAQ